MKYNKNSFILAGDIGGTKTHLALFSKGEKRPKLRAPVYVILNDRAALLGTAIRALMNQQTGS